VWVGVKKRMTYTAWFCVVCGSEVAPLGPSFLDRLRKHQKDCPAAILKLSTRLETFFHYLTVLTDGWAKTEWVQTDAGKGVTCTAPWPPASSRNAWVLSVHSSARLSREIRYQWPSTEWVACVSNQTTGRPLVEYRPIIEAVDLNPLLITLKRTALPDTL
jgi:hypothetical protein